LIGRAAKAGSAARSAEERTDKNGRWNGMGKAKGPGPRSLEALKWLARVDVAGLEPWGLAMGFGSRATYSHAQRLQAAGLVARIYDREGSVVAITPAGRRLACADPGQVPLGATRGLGLRHARAVSWVAALLAARGRDWLSDRELRGRPEWRIPVSWGSSHGTHRPDAASTTAGRSVAVEVELSHKAPRRLRAILAGYEVTTTEGGLSGVLYVSDRDDVLRAVARAAARVGLSHGAVRTRSLASVQAQLRSVVRSPGVMSQPQGRFDEIAVASLSNAIGVNVSARGGRG
jgi:hypothetical protein